MKLNIKRMILATVLALGCGAAQAAPSCFPDMTPPTIVSLTGTPKVGDVVYTSSTVGLVWGYTCKDVAGKYWYVIAAGTWEQFPKDWLFILDTAIRGTDAERKALWDKYAVTDTYDARLIPDLDKVWALLPYPPPSPPVTVWKVLADPFRADKKRVVYTVVNGKRGPSSGQLIAAGEPCDPAVTITEFGPAYFLSVLGNPALIARCVK